MRYEMLDLRKLYIKAKIPDPVKCIWLKPRGC